MLSLRSLQGPAGRLRRRRAVALIIVLSMLALTLVLMTALLSATRVDFNSTVAQVEGAKARLHGDSVINLAISQIQQGTHQDTATSGQEVWASQPGMIRQYKQDGTLLRGLKLYSDSTMVAKTETEIAADTPPADWDKHPVQYVDLNEPVVRINTTDPTGKPRLFFPIIDPRAYSQTETRSVEGFTYSQYANGVSGPALDGVVAPASGGSEADQRLPMPVEWLYMLKDGTLGFLDNTGKFVGTSGSGQTASRDNPMIARVAFWTDDESTKININTAGEGTPWHTPRLFHERDGEWAQYQPMAYEYQRYPGHPATVCMSTVLFPGQNMNPLISETSAFDRALEYKEAIYDLMPKILPGGSKAGSVIVPVNHEFSPTNFQAVQDALGERLFPSVDEFLLRSSLTKDGQRGEISLGAGQIWSGLENYEVVERLRSFLTVRSRASESNPFGYPKISMWPVHRTTSTRNRTVFDNTIVNCSRLAGKDYFFARQDSTSQTELSTIPRNKQLFDYLMALTDQPIPGFGAANASFLTKYGDNREQILIEMFDYIRCTNLYDDNIAERNVGPNPAITGLPDARLTAASAGMAAATFTPMRDSNGNSFPGHGQVTPTVLPKGKNEVYRGMGRFLTISEAGLHFIATAQGTTAAGGVSAFKMPCKGPAPNGYTPPTWKGNGSDTVLNWDNSANWYSNFPPLSAANQDPKKGFYKSRYPTSHKLENHNGDQVGHPGYNPMNWNWTLDMDTPLAPDVKRVQATFLLEWFSPSTGWTLINPDIAIEVDASSLMVGGKRMFPVNGGKTIIRPFKHMSSAWGVYQRGGTISYRAFLQERKLPAVAKGVNGYTSGSILYPDTNIPNEGQAPYSGGVHYTYYSSRPGALQNCNQYNLVSDFIDIPGGDAGRIPFSGGKVVVKILSNKSTPEVLQTFNFSFPGAQFPSPILATKTENTQWGNNSDGTLWVKQPVPPPYWWSFHSDGALGRDKTGKITKIAAVPSTRMGGRFRYIGNEIGSYGDVPFGGTYYRGNLVIPDDTLQSVVLRHGDPRLTMGQYVVPATEFEQHRLYGKQRLAHNIVLANWSEGPGLDRGEDKKGWRLVKDAIYNAAFLPDHPYSPATGAGLQKYGDFDRGIANQTDGAYINKPDEGNTYSITSTTGQKLLPYFSNPWISWVGGSTYFSPNRQVASPGMFGSLPTGVHNAGGAGGMRREPWRTLLFRPQTWSAKQGQQFHIGAPKVLKGYTKNGLPIQGIDPPDYLFMDFFWMPMVEPYVISQPGSTAGKINMNYQMAPFRHIRRATGLAAVMKSELLTAVANKDAPDYLRRPPGAPANQGESWFWKEDTSAAGKKYWHRQIDIDATLKLFDERFSSGFAFISPAQICEMYLLPKPVNSSDTLVPASWPTTVSALLKTSANSILTFWENHALTADNLKERPYTNMYPRLTTRSNTYQIHMRIQTIRKARSSDPAKFVVGVDSTGSEYRGSAMIERYLDFNDPALDAKKNLDYATGNPLSKPSLEDLHRFRILSQKRFDP